MEPEKTKPFEWERMFLGTDTDLMFLLEIVFRTSVIYVFAFLLLRVLGKRGQGNLSPFEFVIIISLGSAVGDPMFYPDVPLVHSMVVIAVIVLFTRTLFRLSLFSRTFETFAESQTACLVSNGVVNEPQLKRENLAHDELMTALREAGIENLGQVRRAYLEPSGNISTFMFAPRDQRPGLPIYPDCDDQSPVVFTGTDTTPEAGAYACRNCGIARQLEAGGQFPECANCGSKEWSTAEKPPDLDAK